MFGTSAKGAPKGKGGGLQGGFKPASDKGLGAKAAPSQKPPSPEHTEKNQQILDALLPCVAAKIDGNGGVLSIQDLCEMQDIKDQLAQIPNSFPKSLPKILSQWTDFFVMMSYGLVGTAIGYDTGLIQADGTLDPAFESTFLPMGKQNYKEHQYVEHNKQQGQNKRTQPIVAPDQQIDLAEATAELTRLCYILEDDAACAEAFLRVKIARKQARGERIPRQAVTQQQQQQHQVYDFSHLDKQGKCREILTRVFEKLNASPDKSLMLNMITQDDAIRELKKGAVMSFMNWFKSFPENFEVGNVNDTTEFKVTLLSDVMPRLPFAGGGGQFKKQRRF